jgi:hypothetical protein
VPLASALSLPAGASDQAWTYSLFIFPAADFHLVFPHTNGFLARRVTERERATVISLASMVSSATSAAVTPLLVDLQGLDTALDPPLTAANTSEVADATVAP